MAPDTWRAKKLTGPISLSPFLPFSAERHTQACVNRVRIGPNTDLSSISALRSMLFLRAADASSFGIGGTVAAPGKHVPVRLYRGCSFFHLVDV